MYNVVYILRKNIYISKNNGKCKYLLTQLYLLCSTQYTTGDIRVDKEETCEVKKPHY